jgi:hypothetical protein
MFERGFDTIVFYGPDGPEEGVTVFKRVPMRESYTAVLRDGPEPGTWYETTHGKTAVAFDHRPDLPGLVQVTIREQQFAYEDLVEFMSFFMMLSGWLGRTKKEDPPSE